MGFNIANDSLQQTAFIIAVVAVAVGIAATVLRFVATSRAIRKHGWEDWFAILATVFLIAYVAPFLYLLVVMNGRRARELSADDMVRMTKAGYVMAAQFCVQQLFAKLSLLCLYYRLFFIQRSFVLCIYFLGAVQVLWSIATYLAHWFECTPPQKLWDHKIPGHCINAPAFLAGGETPNSLVDFALVAMAVWMVQSLRMSTAVKVKLSVLFAIGGLAGIIGFVKIGQGFEPMRSEKVALLDPIWATVQQACAVICCCAPLYKSLIPELGIFQKLSSFSSRAFGRSTRSGGQPQSDEARASATPAEMYKLWKIPENWVQVDESSTRETSLSHTPPPVHAPARRKEEV